MFFSSLAHVLQKGWMSRAVLSKKRAFYLSLCPTHRLVNCGPCFAAQETVSFSLYPTVQPILCALFPGERPSLSLSVVLVVVVLYFEVWYCLYPPESQNLPPLKVCYSLVAITPSRASVERWQDNERAWSAVGPRPLSTSDSHATGV